MGCRPSFRAKTDTCGALQGFLTWSTCGLIVLLLMATSAGTIIGGVASLMASGIKSMAAMTISQKDNINALASPIMASWQQKIKPDVSREKLFNDLNQSVTSYFNAENNQEKNDARQLLISAIAQDTDFTAKEARRKVTEVEQRYQKMKDQIEDKAKKVSRALGTTAIVGFFSFALSAVGAILGGITGIKRNHLINRKP